MAGMPSLWSRLVKAIASSLGFHRHIVVLTPAPVSCPQELAGSSGSFQQGENEVCIYTLFLVQASSRRWQQEVHAGERFIPWCFIVVYCLLLRAKWNLQLYMIYLYTLNGVLNVGVCIHTLLLVQSGPWRWQQEVRGGERFIPWCFTPIQNFANSNDLPIH